ncbi:ABC transporter substrate-binding protein [Geomesophilobacter sediminis]|uniref:ABC transporter substrate-binding protein n=1 Tax=Geomesophilobacter sediminis TaxID=2798584 RepID=A0A8J7M2F1_9BACT|nr:ABC transporter substrate-binding protein [Geomesophilobacter sediminis]MBJ6727412.1 ABC transporter substrate-binding protein [Geomesophilobacter sediminis]
MKRIRKIVNFRNRALLCLLALLLLVPSVAAWSASADPNPVPAERLKQGERIYRNGILPSGQHVKVKGDPAARGTTFSCASCHLRSGIGALEENVFTPPITVNRLFQPRQIFFKANYPVTQLRPAYTDATLLAAIRDGKDPAGREFNNVMPRYDLSDADAKILLDYLKNLSVNYSPGVTSNTLKFATVITEDVPQEERDAMLGVLNQYIAIKNSQSRAFGSRMNSRGRLMAENMLGSRDLTVRQLSLSTWVLKGAPETWRAQLEELYRKEPVFALIGGISHRDWTPVHRFSEDNGLPCLFPLTDFPAITDSDWYTLYLSKGYYQEGEGAARYLNGEEVAKEPKVVQLVRSSNRGRALAAGFQKTWSELGHPVPVTVNIAAGERLDRALLDKVLAREKPAVLLVWDDATALGALDSLASRKERPRVFLSGRYLGKGLWSIKEELRGFTYLTYPFSFSPYQPKIGMGRVSVQGDSKTALRQGEVPLKDRVETVQALTRGMVELVTTALMDMRDNYYRDAFLDVLGAMMDQYYPLYGRVGFGASQRYAARGCYITQLGKGADPQLIKKNGWEQ